MRVPRFSLLAVAVGAGLWLPGLRPSAAEEVSLSPEDVIRDATTYATVVSSVTHAVSSVTAHPSAATPSRNIRPRAGPGSPSVRADAQNMLIEMRERRILDSTAGEGSSEDRALLALMREAEALGAFDLLRERVGPLRGLAIEHRFSRTDRRLWLTKDGFQRYLFLKSQLARKYFEGMGTDAKYAFQLYDVNGKRLFDGNGLLTAAGDAVYNRILRRLPVQWKNPNGEVVGNTRPTKNTSPTKGDAKK